MQSLKEKKRDVFDVIGQKGIFSVEKQSRKLSEQDLSVYARTPVYSSQSTNNGVMGFTDKDADFAVHNKPVLIFGDHTRSMDIANYSFCAADNIKILQSEDMSFDELIYVSCVWKKRIPDMGYARHWRKAKTVGIELPVDDEGAPDYEYMAQYTRQKRKMMLDKYREYVEASIVELGDVVDIPVLDEKEWTEFTLNDIFTVEAGKRLETRNKMPGTCPFIGATDNGNGITGYVANDNASKDCNVLGVNYNGAPCIAFYHPYECIFTDDVKRLHLCNYEDNKFVLLFFVSIFAQQKVKYSYGYKFNEQRMLRQKLMLPVDDAGEPDYAYMEQYAKNMMFQKYKQYLTFLETKNILSSEDE